MPVHHPRSVLILNQIEVISAAPLSAGRLGNSVDVERAAYGLAEMKTPSPHHVGAPSGMGGLVASRAISMLTPYVNSWAIKGRITMLEEPRAFSRGKVMTIQIADEVRSCAAAPLSCHALRAACCCDIACMRCMP